MSKIKPGQVGDFNGKIGQVVVSKWRELIVGRSTPRKTSKLPTDKQMEVRSKFALITAFINKLKTYIALGYPKVVRNQSGRNIAVKYHLDNAVIESADGYEVDYEKVVLSRGDLFSVYDIEVKSLPNREISVEWTTDIMAGDGTNVKDKVAFVTYCPELGTSTGLYPIAERGDLTATLNLMRAYAGKTVHAYMFLVSVDGKSTSDSEYLGSYVIT